MSEAIVYGILLGVVLQLTLDVVGKTINLLKWAYKTLVREEEA